MAPGRKLLTPLRAWVLLATSGKRSSPFSQKRKNSGIEIEIFLSSWKQRSQHALISTVQRACVSSPQGVSRGHGRARAETTTPPDQGRRGAPSFAFAARGGT